MNNYFGVMSRYFQLGGRATRREYWGFQLAVFLLAFVAAFVDIGVLGYLDPRRGTGFGPLLLFVIFFHAIPSFTSLTRRLHDAGKSARWHLISLVPFIGGLWMLYLSCKGPNDNSDTFGPDPRFEPAMHSERRRAQPSRAQLMVQQMEDRRRRMSV